MARETKVGLLAGLAFIICFAIILANGGRQKQATTHWPYLTDQGVDVQQAAHELGSRTALHPRPATRDERLSNQQALTTPPVSASHPVRVDRLQSSDNPLHRPASGGENVLPTRPLHSSTPQLSEEQQAISRTTQLDQVPSTATQTARTTTSPHGTMANDEDAGMGDWDQRRRALEGLLDRRTTSVVRQAEATGGMRQDSPPPAASVDTKPPATKHPARSLSPTEPPSHPADSNRYKVEAGDTLSRIAFAHYGSRSSTVIDAIFHANRSTLSSPDLLPVGMELMLPVLDGFTDPRGQGLQETIPSTPTPRPESPIGKSLSAFRWYQIARNDRYVSIAREQLGDASRWRELFELNKDRFPDPDRIQHGVRIKIPLGNATARTATTTGARP